MINAENEKEMDNPEKISDLNDLFKRTYEFDIFKYVSRGLIKSQQNYEILLKELKSENLNIKNDILLLKEEINNLKEKANTNFFTTENKVEEKDKGVNIQNLTIDLQNKKQNYKNSRKNINEKRSYTNNNINDDSDSNKNKTLQKSTLQDINKSENKNSDNNYENKNTDEKEMENTNTSMIKLTNTYINEIVNQNCNKKEKETNQNIINIDYINSEFKKIKSNLEEINKEFNQFKSITNQTIFESNNNMKTNISDNITKLKEESKKELNSLNIDINQKLVLLNDTTKNLTEKNIENEKLMNKTNSFINKFVQLKTDYVSYDDFEKYKNDIYDKLDNETRELSIDLSMVKNSVNSIKNELINIVNDTTLNDNFIKLKQRQDTTLALVEKLRDIQKENNQKGKSDISINTSLLVNIDTFNEYQKNQMKIIDKMKRDFNDLGRELNEIKIVDLANKTSLKDLKNLEDIILNKMEDLLLHIKKKFVEKKDLDKFIKLVDYQTKQTLEEFKLSLKPGTNWLLAKKSLGHLCASCEAFIGNELQTPTEKNIIWNKYSSKASGDNKNIKLGMGYSKIIGFANENEKEKDREKITSFSLDKNNVLNARHNSLNNKKRIEVNEELSNINLSNNSSRVNKLNLENNNSFQTDEFETDILSGSLPQIRKRTLNQSSIDDRHLIKHSIKSLKDIKKSQRIVDTSDYIIKTSSQRARNERNEISFGPKITKIFKKFNNSKHSEQLNNESKKICEC